MVALRLAAQSPLTVEEALGAFWTAAPGSPRSAVGHADHDSGPKPEAEEQQNNDTHEKQSKHDRAAADVIQQPVRIVPGLGLAVTILNERDLSTPELDQHRAARPDCPLQVPPADRDGLLLA